jgi:hypothetical protein
MNRIFYQSIVKEYYRQNAIFIFAVMMFAFGFLRANEHLAIIKEALHSPLVLSGICLIWVAYGVKVTFFTLRFLSQRSSEFLFHARLFSPLKRFFAFLNLQFGLIQLTFFYAVVMVGNGILESTWTSVLAIVLVNVLILVGGALAYSYKIKHPNSQQDAVRKYFRFNFTTPQWLFFPRYLLTQQTVLVFITKCFTAFILMGACYLYPTDDYDIRLITLGSLLVSFSQSVIIQNVQFFEQFYFCLYRNMPISRLNWALRYVGMTAVIVIPEAMVLLRNLPDSLSFVDGFIQILFIISVAFALLSYQLFRIRNNETGFQIVFFTGVGLALLIMFKVPNLAFILVSVLLGYVLLWKYFYEVE